jgi:transcriptional regulator with XRE-family HTH domain
MDIEARKLFGRILRDVREGSGWTMEELGRKIRKSKGYLSGIENAKCSPPIARVTVRLCKALRMKPDGLLLLAEVAKAPDEVLRLPTYQGFARSVWYRALYIANQVVAGAGEK